MNFQNPYRRIFYALLFSAVIAAYQPINAQAEDNAPIQGGVEENIIFSLVDCIDKALENNPEIKAATSTTDIFKSKIGQAKSNYVPRAAFSTGYTRLNPLVNSKNFAMPDNSYNSYNFASISLDQLVYDFGKTSALVKASKLNHESSQKELQATINNITYQVKEAYYQLLFAQKKRDVMQDFVNKYQEHLNQATAFYKAGTHPKIDVTIARCNLSNANLNLIKAKNDVAIAYATLNNSMGLPKQATYTIKDQLAYDKLNVEFDKLIAQAYQSRPELMSAKLKTEASEKILKLSKKATIPDIQASTAYNVGGGEFFDDAGFSLGIKMDLPVTNVYKVKKQVDEARAQLNRDVALSEKMQNDVFMQTKQAYLNLKEAEEQIPVSELLQQQSKETYDLASARYKAGIGDVIELKDSETEYKNAQVQYFRSILDYNIAVANLERVVGSSEF